MVYPPVSTRFSSINRFLVIAPFCLAFVHSSAQAQALGQLQALGQVYVQAKSATETSVRLTIYRTKTDADPAAVSVYVGASYHTSLLPGGFTEFCVKPLPIEIGLRPLGGLGGQQAPLNVVALSAQAGSQQFFRVANQQLSQGESSERRVVLQPRSRQEAEAELAQTREQIHTLSRASAVVPCEVASVLQ